MKKSRWFLAVLFTVSMASQKSLAASAKSGERSLGGSDAIEFEFGPETSKSRHANLRFADANLEKISQAMRGEAYRSELRKQIIVPISSSNEELIRVAGELSREEREEFLQRKIAYLENVADILNLMSVQPEKANEILNLLNDELFARAQWIARDAEYAFGVSIGAGAKISAPDVIRSGLRSAPLISRLAEHDGFAMGFSVGLAFRQKMVDGKPHYSIVPTAGLSRGTKFWGGLLSLGGGLSLSARITNPASDESQKLRFISYAGNSISVSPDEVSIGSGFAGFSVPPFGSAFGAYQGETAEVTGRPRLLLDYVSNQVQGLWQSVRGAPSCRALLSR